MESPAFDGNNADESWQIDCSYILTACMQQFTQHIFSGSEMMLYLDASYMFSVFRPQCGTGA
jgi:hypothetical protein